MKRKSKLNRVNILAPKYNESTIKEWSPVLEQYGITPGTFHDSMALYCHYHTLNHSYISETKPTNPSDNFQGILSAIPPSIVPQTLPFILNMVKDLDKIKKIRIIPIPGPAYITLIEDNQYYNEIGTIDCDYAIPAMSVEDKQTNLFEIYEERMLECFQNKLLDYLESIPNADTLVVYSFGELFLINEIDTHMLPKIKIRFRFRVKAFNDATYMPGITTEQQNEEIQPGEIQEIQPGEIQPPYQWVIEFKREPGFIKRSIMKLLCIKFIEKRL